MRKKIVGILVLTLLFASVFPAIGTVNTNEEKINNSLLLVDNDYELTDIIKPVTGPASGSITPLVRVTNLGNESETSVPVNVTIEKITTGGTVLEYSQTVFVDFDAYEVKDISFPVWTPADWQIVENEVIQYLVCACVLSPTDPNPTNDCKCVSIDIYYPYFHDVGVESIDSPPICVKCNSTESVEVTVKNYGQYPERLFFVHVEISDGTSIFYDEYGAVTAWLQPDGTITLVFPSIYFDTEGVYYVTACTQLSIDENPSNDCLTKTIYVDCTPPVTTVSLDPAAPNGKNGWYVTCPTVTLIATDAVSGVANTFYRIDGASWMTYTAPFKICDCEHTLEYYSVDNCGNEEAVKSIYLKIDTEPPVITFRKSSVPPPPLFCYKYTAVVYDNCSGVEGVEFYFDDILQETITGSGPIFEWIKCGLGNHTIYAIAYDNAGNSGTSNSLARNKGFLIQNRAIFLQLLNLFFQRFSDRFTFIFQGTR